MEADIQDVPSTARLHWQSLDCCRPDGLTSFRTEVDAHGCETGIEAPIILSNEPLPPPQTRSPSYLEMQGGATIEAEVGMQLYEDVYLNNYFGDGNGPAEGGYDRLRTLREFQLSLGVKFALSMSWLDLPNRKNYEPVLDYVTPGLEGSQNGRRVNHYQLKPGTQHRGKAGPSEKEEPQDTSQQPQELSDCVKNLLAKYFDRSQLDAIRVHTDGLPWFVPSGMDAYTSNNDFYYAQGRYDPQSARGIAVIGHEVVHAQQYSKSGNLRFKAKYLFSSVVAGIGVTVGRRGSAMPTFDSAKAYYGNKFEKEAERKEEEIFSDLRQQFGDKNPCP